MIRNLFVSIVVIGVVGCGDSTPAPSADAPPPPPPPIVAEAPPAATPTPAPITRSVGPAASTKTKSAIDWSAAREDLSAASGSTVTIQSADEAPAEVPVLLPTGIVISQSADAGPVYRTTPDGYIAFYPGPEYNIVVNGTNESIASDAMISDNPDKAPLFSATTGGAQVWLTRYGADYIVEFECNATVSEEETCISEEDAMTIVEKLIVARSR